jgi:hypothetical protein
MSFIIKLNPFFMPLSIIYAPCSCIGLVIECHFWCSDLNLQKKPKIKIKKK